MVKLLLVEDTAVNRELLARRFAKWGQIEVICAEDGKEGVQKALSEKPDIILMDMGLPVMNGWIATMLLKMDARTAAIPVIAVTAYAFRSDQIKCQEHGCDDFMAKPIDFKVLNDKINHWLSVDPEEVHASARRARHHFQWDNRVTALPLEQALEPAEG
jgi:CheY-like chemotaxis protein